jgi:hypothetical protein
VASTTIINGAPMTISRGVQDKSTRPLPIQPDILPTHLPKIYVYAQKGPSTGQLVVGNGRDLMYGSGTFDLRMPFANHQTVLANLVNAKGNSQMIERVIPVDAGPRANFLLSLDVLTTTVVQYQRGTDGKFLLDNLGFPIPIAPAATLPGFKCKWVISSIIAGAGDETLFGVAASGPGDQMTTGGTPVQSVRYPIMEFWANSQGSIFNNSGFRIWAPTVSSAGGVNTKFIASNKAYPFRMAAISRLTSTSTAKIVETQSGGPYFDFSLKLNQIDPATEAQFSLKDTFASVYQNLGNPNFTPVYGDLNGLHIYQDNIETLTALFYASEKAHIAVGSDWTVGATDEQHLFNFVGGTSSMDTPYFTFQLDSSAIGSTRLSSTTNQYAAGGSDGTMNNTLFDGLVASAVVEYANPQSYLQNTAVYAESIIYDTGFSLTTKKALTSFIAERKDTAVVLSTYTVGDLPYSAAVDHSIGVALRTKLQMYPESDYYGTSTMRGVVMGRSGVLRNSLYAGRLPLTMELAVMAASFMGAGDGIWKQEALFDRSPNNVITLFDDVSVPFTPATQRNSDWDIGLNYAMSFSRKQLYFPAIKTVYDNDTSVLNSFFTMMACVEIQKVGERVHREFSGAIDLTNAQLIEKVNKAVEVKTNGRFAGLYKIVPAAYMSDGDLSRGFSWTLPIKLYANNMRTVMTLSIEAYRMTDFTAAV